MPPQRNHRKARRCRGEYLTKGSRPRQDLLYSRRGNGAEKDSKETLAETLRLSMASAEFLERVVKDSGERLIFMVLIKTSCRKRPVRSFTGSADFNRWAELMQR